MRWLDIIKKDKKLYQSNQEDKLTSIIFYWILGTGKKTFAQVIAQTTSVEFTSINGTISGEKEMKAVVKAAKQKLQEYLAK